MSSDNNSELNSPASLTTNETSEESCYSCGSKSKKVSVVCCDCGVKMCKQCARNACDDDYNNCGCYGNCSNCNKNINRGDHDWPCSECDEWYCSYSCRKTSKCDDCLDSIDKDTYIAELEAKIKKLEKKLQTNNKNIN